MPKARPMYSKEFKAEAVKLVKESGKPAVQISRDLGVSVESLRAWVKQQEIDSGQREGLTTSEREELRKLRAENRILRMERKIKKAAHFLLEETNEDLTLIFSFVEEEKAALPYCHIVSRSGVSASGYYDWLKARISDHTLQDWILLKVYQGDLRKKPWHQVSSEDPC